MRMRVIITNYPHTYRFEGRAARMKITRKEGKQKTKKERKKKKRIQGGFLISFVLTIPTTNRTSKINIKINNDAAMRVLFCLIDTDIWRSLASKLSPLVFDTMVCAPIFHLGRWRWRERDKRQRTALKYLSIFGVMAQTCAF